MNASELIKNKFLKFGINKLREVERLLNEISKVEKLSIEKLLNEDFGRNYENVKKNLLARRYPKNFNKVPLSTFYFPQYSLDESLAVDTTYKKFNPKNVYYESLAANYELLSKVKKTFPNSNFIEIDSLKNFMKTKNYSIADYNKRQDNLFIVYEKYSFFKKCPCSSHTINCGYHIMNLGMGCLYECSYCFLQGYQNVSGIIWPCNIKDYLCAEKITASTSSLFNYKRVGSGEWTDSLIFDDITGFSKPIIEFFKDNKDITFEFKTKSVNIKNLLSCGGCQNITAAWSVNAIKIQKENEFKTSEIIERLNAAKLCAQAGFNVAFHFDPIILFDGCENAYKEIVDMIFDIVPNFAIKWISLGTLRMPAILKSVIENRFPQSDILNAELLLGKDYKLRYDSESRVEIYKYMTKIINAKKSKTKIYLCMESSNVWKKCNLI
ncbi:MAG: hypothetical protein LBU55_02860 [Elusimicrobiota bacterium]|jgi:spore photoproduct lyase|nr:hypothetical protein [Elusimicrobiota bacterium]